MLTSELALLTQKTLRTKPNLINFSLITLALLLPQSVLAKYEGANVIENPDYKTYQDYLSHEQEIAIKRKLSGSDVNADVPGMVQSYLPMGEPTEENILKLNTSLIRSVYVASGKKSNDQPTSFTILEDTTTTTLISDLVNVDEYPNLDKKTEQQKQNEEFTQRVIQGQVSKEEIYDMYQKVMFPVVPTKISPRVMPTRSVSVNEGYEVALSVPLSVIGMDKYSLDWLELNKEEIKRNGSLVLLTQVENMSDYELLRTHYPDLQFLPINAEEAMEKIGIDFYPVMMTRYGIFQ
ncbi:PFL_4695 family integrating conjugative element protein [Vibrio crassostreae]|uniref:PFL_4695 family integrating conjugative element protein n=1 Tax=Vibrio crassostreae TaxID=246167 RepID=UPI001B305D43|nr:integrating conjugative element protein [Vibrio crassostreae]